MPGQRAGLTYVKDHCAVYKSFDRWHLDSSALGHGRHVEYVANITFLYYDPRIVGFHLIHELLYFSV